jgi:hypothetical protein
VKRHHKLPHINISCEVLMTLNMKHFTFMGPRIVNVFKYNQQDATLHNGIYYYKCSTCFRRFLYPSSGAQNCIHSIWYCQAFSASYRYCGWDGTSFHVLLHTQTRLKLHTTWHTVHTSQPEILVATTPQII